MTAAEVRQVSPILTPGQAADLLGISRWKLDELRKLNNLPKGSWFEIPSAGTGQKQIIRYRAHILIEWVGPEIERLNGEIAEDLHKASELC